MRRDILKKHLKEFPRLADALAHFSLGGEEPGHISRRLGQAIGHFGVEYLDGDVPEQEFVDEVSHGEEGDGDFTYQFETRTQYHIWVVSRFGSWVVPLEDQVPDVIGLQSDNGMVRQPRQIGEALAHFGEFGHVIVVEESVTWYSFFQDDLDLLALLGSTPTLPEDEYELSITILKPPKNSAFGTMWTKEEGGTYRDPKDVGAANPVLPADFRARLAQKH